MKKSFFSGFAVICTAGPVAVPSIVRNAFSQQTISHRTDDFRNNFYLPVSDSLKSMTNSSHVLFIGGSGSAALDGCAAAILPNGGKILVLSNDYFGNKLGNIFCPTYYDTEVISLDGGRGWNLKRAHMHIDWAYDHGFGAIGIVHHATGLGILNQVEEICLYAKKKGMMTLVDGVSAFPAYSFDQKNSGIDFYACSIQKGFACPPGLGLVYLSQEAHMVALKAPKRSNFNHLADYITFAKDLSTPFTPPVNHFYALKESINCIIMEGLKDFQNRHAEMAQFVRTRLAEMGFKLVAEPGYESSTITAFMVDNAKMVKSKLEEKYNVWLSDGLGPVWNETSLRFCNMGDVSPEQLDFALNALKKVAFPVKHHRPVKKENAEHSDIIVGPEGIILPTNPVQSEVSTLPLEHEIGAST